METIFRILVPVVILGFAIHRGYYVRNHSQPEMATLKKREEGLTSKISGLLGLFGFLSAIVFVIDPSWLAFAKMALPPGLRWIGFGVAIAGFALLQWSQLTLGKSWSDTPRMIENQNLITSGPYRFIRHPIYTAFILILGSILWISANWFLGPTWLGMTLLEVTSRIRFEEALMLEFFGAQYQSYMNRTGQLFPKLIQ